MKRFLNILLLFILFYSSVRAQVSATVDECQDSITVSLITYYPGSQVYELYGHTGIRVVLPDGNGVLFNYGIFDFDAPNFVYRFVAASLPFSIAYLRIR